MPVPPLTITRHAIEQFREHVADLPDADIQTIIRQVHRDRILLTANDPKHPDTPFYWGTHQGLDFAIAIGPDANNPEGEYAATTIGLGHLERILRAKRARGTVVEAIREVHSESGSNRPFADLSLQVREDAVLDWPEEGQRALIYTVEPGPGMTAAWAQAWRWIEKLTGAKVRKLEYLPQHSPPGWWATLRVGTREPRCFLGSSPMVELYIIDQPARLIPFEDVLESGRVRVVPLPAGNDSHRGLPDVVREAPLAELAPGKSRRLGVRALYPGTFDPITRGHLHLLQRACQLFETVVIAAAVNADKSTVFSIEERMAFIRQEVQAAGLEGVEVISYDELTVDLALNQDCQVLVRGLRAVSDYEYEVQMAIINRQIAPNVDTVFLMADQHHSFISSSIIKDILRHGGSIERVAGMVSPAIAQELQARLLGEAALPEP